MSEVPAESRPGGAPNDASREEPLGKRWLQTIPGLADHALRVAFAQAQLEQLTSTELAAALNEVCQLAEQSDPIGREAVGAFLPTLVNVEALELVGALRTTAANMALLSVGRLLRASTEEGHLLDQRGNPNQKVMQNAAGKPLSLGERRALARQPSRATLDKLMRDPHPMVTRIVLGNPRITEDDVVRMAAYRPAVPRVAGEVAMAWSRSTRVRLSLVLNPTVPPAIAVPLLFLLTRPELGQVVRAADLAAVTRATAHEHHELRPPLPPVDAPLCKH